MKSITWLDGFRSPFLLGLRDDMVYLCIGYAGQIENKKDCGKKTTQF